MFISKVMNIFVSHFSRALVRVCSQPIEMMWAKSKGEVGADWHRKRTLDETYQVLTNSWFWGQSTNAAARRFFEFAAIHGGAMKILDSELRVQNGYIYP